MLEPDVLLMDERLFSLDPELNLRLRKEILALQKKLNFTISYVTHGREEAVDMAPRVVSMRKGRVVAQDSTVLTGEDLPRLRPGKPGQVLCSSRQRKRTQ